MQLKNKVAFITGAGSGIGKAIALAYAREGAAVVIADLNLMAALEVDKQIPEQAKTLGISEEDVIKKIMLSATVDGEFTTTEDIADVAVFFAAFPTNALTGQSLLVSHGWVMD